jgi:hypothetical protein
MACRWLQARFVLALAAPWPFGVLMHAKKMIDVLSSDDEDTSTGTMY